LPINSLTPILAETTSSGAQNMLSKNNLSVCFIFSLLLFVSPSLFAAGKCVEVRTESTFELINAPAQEMQGFRSASAAVSCVFLKDFIARSKKPGNGFDPSPSSAGAANGAYVPKTKDDNTPWRFDMNQNGKRMTSVEFDAWMKAKGIRVAKGRPGVEPVPECVPSKEVKC